MTKTKPRTTKAKASKHSLPTKNTKVHIIDCGTPDHATLAYMAMFRYAFGRMTYMPGVVIDIIKGNKDTLMDKCLFLLNRDLSEEAERYERLYKDKTISNYGTQYDREVWCCFHKWVKKEMEKRDKAAKLEKKDAPPPCEPIR